MKLNHSRPEMITANCATAEVWRYMGLPFCCNMANTGNGDFGPLSAFEKAIQYYSVMLSGINMCYGLGCYEEGMLLRPSDLIFANEVIGYLETLVKGFPVDQDTLAEDLIDEVGPGGYLSHGRTYYGTLVQFLDTGQAGAQKAGRRSFPGTGSGGGCAGDH